jgi:hypothetical protein
MALLATVTEVRKKYGPAANFRVEWENSIPGAGPKGGPGRPDIVLRTGAATLVWDVKPYSETGISAGRKQMDRYLNGLPKSAHGRRGDRLPDRVGVPVSFTEYLDVKSGSVLEGTGGLELYRVRPRDIWPAVEPVRLPQFDPHRFRIHWRRGLVGASLVTATVGLGILAPEADLGGWGFARVTGAFGG